MLNLVKLYSVSKALLDNSIGESQLDAVHFSIVFKKVLDWAACFHMVKSDH